MLHEMTCSIPRLHFTQQICSRNMWLKLMKRKSGGGGNAEGAEKWNCSMTQQYTFPAWRVFLCKQEADSTEITSSYVQVWQRNNYLRRENGNTFIQRHMLNSYSAVGDREAYTLQWESQGQEETDWTSPSTGFSKCWHSIPPRKQTRHHFQSQKACHLGRPAAFTLGLNRGKGGGGGGIVT